MTTLHQRKTTATEQQNGRERRAHRRADLEQKELTVQRHDGGRGGEATLGKLVDLSAGGVRIRTSEKNIRPDHQIRVRLELPEYAGISPFVANNGKSAAPKREWVGWMAVSRVQKLDEKHSDVAGRLVDMDEMDRGMLGLYLSTQPLAA